MTDHPAAHKGKKSKRSKKASSSTTTHKTIYPFVVTIMAIATYATVPHVINLPLSITLCDIVLVIVTTVLCLICGSSRNTSTMCSHPRVLFWHTVRVFFWHKSSATFL